MAIIDLPYQNIIDRESGPTNQGYDLEIVQYSGKVSQRAFNGPSVKASKTGTWKVIWKLLEYDPVVTPQYDLNAIRDFEQLAQTNLVRWKPFEENATIIWRLKENSLSVKNTAGNIFTASVDLEYLYEE